jgi:hypothetical protein
MNECSGRVLYTTTADRNIEEKNIIHQQSQEKASIKRLRLRIYIHFTFYLEGIRPAKRMYLILIYWANNNNNNSIQVRSCFFSFIFID